MFRPLASSAMALMVAASPVFAEVTPAEVWDNLALYYDKLGYEVSIGSRDEGGNQLLLEDVVVTSPAGEGQALTITMPQITLSQTGDARVRTVFDQDITVAVVSPIPDEDDLELDMIIAIPGNEMLSSGTADDLLHEFNYPSFDMTLNLPVPEAEPVPMRLSLTDLKGSQTTKISDGSESVYDMTAAAMDLAFAMTEPDAEDGTPGEGSMAAELKIADLSMSGRMTAPDGVDISNDMGGALTAGLVTDGKITTGPITGSFDFRDNSDDGDDQNASGSFTTENSELEMAMSREGLSYDARSGRTEFEVNVSDLPFPISYATDAVSGALTLPFAKSDQPQPFSFAYEIAGLTMADGIWALFDEAGQLPRDPASLAIDIEGDMLVLEDIFDPAFGQSSDDDNPLDAADMPFMPQNLTINRIALDAIGASAEVTGALEMGDNPQEPVGEINGSFSGINGLMDNLVAMGVVPQEQVMGLRMMLAMFTKTVDGNPDQLETHLEFREGGAIFANGQQVK